VLRARLPSPIGPLGLAATDLGLARVRFPPRAAASLAVPAIDPAVAPADDGPRDRAGAPDAAASPRDGHLEQARRELGEYFAGRRKSFEVPLDWSGVTGLRRAVLEVLASQVPFGDTITYGELARRAGAPGAAQAVGAIMGSNPLPIVVPCHRVLAADGLGGFGGGLVTKEWLLGWEGVLPQALVLPPT